MDDQRFPVWRRRRLPSVHVLHDPREALAVQVRARLDRLRALGFDEPTEDERERNQFSNVDLPLHSRRSSDNEPTPKIEVKHECSHPDGA